MKPDTEEIVGWKEAWEEARRGLEEGGVPIGAALVRAGRVLSRGHNLRYQTGDVTAHAEIVAIRNAGLISLRELKETTIVSTLLPCFMCSGAIVHLGIPAVIAGLASMAGQQLPSHQFLLQRGVKVIDLQRFELMEPMLEFTKAHPEDWMEDMGTVLDSLGGR